MKTAAAEEQQAARASARWWAGASLVALVLWLTVVLVDLFSPLKLAPLSLGLALIYMLTRATYLSARIDLADANMRRLTEILDGDR